MIQLIFISYVLLVIFLSLIPLPSSGGGMYTDKIAHFVMYTGVAFLAYLSVRPLRKRLYLFVLSLLLGVSLELIQIYVPGRSASLFDVAADTAGVFTGFLLCWILSKLYDGLSTGGERYPVSND